MVFSVGLHLADCSTCVLSGGFVSCHSPAVWQESAKLSPLHCSLLALSYVPSFSSSQVHLPLFQSHSPLTIFLSNHLCVSQLGHLCHFWQTPLGCVCWFWSEFWLWIWFFFLPSLDIIWSHPARGSLVPYLCFVFHNLPYLSCLCLAFSCVICHLGLCKEGGSMVETKLVGQKQCKWDGRWSSSGWRQEVLKGKM